MLSTAQTKAFATSFGTVAGSALFGFAVVAIGLAAPGAPHRGSPAELSQASGRRALPTDGGLPLLFIANQGQIDSRVRFHARAGDQGFYFTPSEAVFAFVERSRQSPLNSSFAPLATPNASSDAAAQGGRGIALAMQFVGANADVKLEGRNQATTTVNYLVGNNPAKWRSGLPTYREIVYREQWPGIDVVFRADAATLKYEFVLQPGASVDSIRLTFRGADDLSLDEDGNLLIHTPLGVLTDEKPISYQHIAGIRTPVESRFVLLEDADHGRTLGFQIGEGYDPAHALIIDPDLVFASYLGGSTSSDIAYGLATDDAGNLYVTGLTHATDFPVTPGAFDETHNGGSSDVFVAKLDASGSNLIFATYLGGSGSDIATGITVDEFGNIYLTGRTESADFPTTEGAYDDSFSGSTVDGFVTKLNPSGSALVYSTYVGASGANYLWRIVIDGSGNACVIGWTNSPDFPTTANAVQATHGGGTYNDAVVAMLDATGSSLLYSTYLGGSAGEYGLGIALDGLGNISVTGTTQSPDFPVTPGAFDESYHGHGDDPAYGDVFVAKIDPAAGQLVYSTYVGGAGAEAGWGVADDGLGNTIVAGNTGSTGFPVTPGAFDESYNGGEAVGGSDGFVLKLDAAGSNLLYATFLGGRYVEWILDLDVDSAGNAYVAGGTTSRDFPVTAQAFDCTYNGGLSSTSFFGDAFVAALDATGESLLYCTYVGGYSYDVANAIALDASGNINIAGQTRSPNFPATPGAFDTSLNGSFQDAFAAKLEPIPPVAGPIWPVDSALTATNVRPSRALLTWTPADGCGLQYLIYQDAALVATVSTTSYSVGGLTPASESVFKVESCDRAGNCTADGPSVIVVTPGVCFALDPTFGDGGLVTTDFPGPNTDRARAVIAVQPDGKIVTAGTTQSAAGYDFAVARYNPDGSLDSSFGDAGQITTDFGSTTDRAFAVAVQTDAKILVAGYSNAGSPTGYDFALARYNSDGTLDADFGSGGLVTTDLGSTSDQAFGVAVDADSGKIVVVGYSYRGSPTGYDFALACYNSDGSLDAGFGSGGLVITNFSSTVDQAFGVALDAGKIVVAGRSHRGSPTNYDFALVRYNSDGSLDSGFGNGGLATTDFGSSNDFAYGLAIQGAGQIVVAGYSRQTDTGYDFALARYNSDGSPDTNFGIVGMVTTDFGSNSDFGQSVVVRTDGKIILAGYTYSGNPTGNDFGIVCYNADGSLHSGFDSDGLMTVDFANSTDLAFGVAVQADDKIVAAGLSYSGGPRGYDFALARIDTDGSLDSGFGVGGQVMTDFVGPNNDYARDLLAVQADGKIVVVGQTSGATSDFALARYNPDGSLDETFGDGGQVTTDFAGSSDSARAVAIQADGKIVVAGSAGGGAPTWDDFALARYNSDGSLDTTFGEGGLVTTHFGYSSDYANSVAIQDDGKIVAAGYSRWYSWDFAVARYNTDGSLDTGFGDGGLVRTDFAGGYEDIAYNVAIGSAGKIVLAGYSLTYYPTYTYYDFALARYNADGSLDTGFGDGGLVTTDFASNYDYNYDVAYGLAIQSTGKIVLVGYSSQPGTGYDFALARYNAHGGLDSSFGNAGLVTTDFGGTSEYAYDVFLQADDSIVVVGSNYGGFPTYSDFALVRYDSDGSLDTCPVGVALATTDFAAGSEQAFAVTIQADGRIILAGSTAGAGLTGSDFALARYEGVVAPQQSIEVLIADVQDLVPDPLNNGQGNALLMKLQAAIQHLDRENVTAATSALEALINQILAFIDTATMLPEEGTPLIDSVIDIISQL